MSEQSNTHTLATPITKSFRQADGSTRDEQITAVTVRKPVAGDLRAMDSQAGDIGKALALMAKLTGLDVRDVDKLDIGDFGALSDIVEGFNAAWPQNWGDVVGGIAATFHFPMAELWGMDADDLTFWAEQAERQAERMMPS